MKFGTDPEYLVVNKLGRPVPAHVAGLPDKDNKCILEGWSGIWESRCFRDGYMVEINVQPDSCRQTVTHRMQRALVSLKRKLSPRYTIVALPAVQINLKSMATAPADVRQFGCEPSFDAYELAAKIPPIDALTHPYRYAGGHLHFGYVAYEEACTWMLNKDNHPQFIKMLDLYLGVPLTYLFDSKQTFLRRRFYGQAGEYRSQKYGRRKSEVGVEYRTPGPEVWNAPWVASFALGVGRYVGQNFRQLAKKWNKSVEDDLRLAINTGEGLAKLLKLASLPDYDEYPADFRPLKSAAPKKLVLPASRVETINDGFRHAHVARRKGVLRRNVRYFRLV